MRHDWICYTARCEFCGHAGLLKVWSEGPGWGYTATGLIAAAVNRLHPEKSVVRCLACLSSVVTLKRQFDSPHCASAICPFNSDRSQSGRMGAIVACPLHATSTRIQPRI